ncbi:MAG: right-handed parallel beta-helix repeat-containing protein [Candidatus Coatesbacteria bacterium]|nr:right-handed parallel beta-helix repeat-containing protein [Candidatus Coatesbacteria bacterium]
MNKSVAILLFLILHAIGTCAICADYYVDALRGNDTNNGMSPDEAWCTIHCALSNVACSVEDPAIIHVAAGIYSSSTNGESFPLEMRSNQALRGACAEETVLNAEGNAYEVIKCEYTNNSAIESLTIKGGRADSGSYGEWARGGGMYILGVTDLTIFDCIITDNDANAGAGIYCVDSALEIKATAFLRNDCVLNTSGNGWGGGICSENSSLTVSDSSFSGNSSYFGGASFLEDSQAYFKGCKMISNNGIGDLSGLSWGGGIGVYASSVQLLACQLSDNTAINGGAIYCGSGSFLEISECDLSDNTAEITDGYVSRGGAISAGDSEIAIYCSSLTQNSANIGGGVYCFRSTGLVSDCGIYANSAWRGAGARFERCDGASIEGCDVEQNLAVPDEFGWCEGGGIQVTDSHYVSIIYCMVRGNSAWEGAGIAIQESVGEIDGCVVMDNHCTLDKDDESAGGGIYLRNGRSHIVRNCLIQDNSAVKGGGICAGPSNAAISNCTVSGNTAEIGGGLFCAYNCSADISDTIVWANSNSIDVNETASVYAIHSCIEGGWDGEGNIFSDPLFATGHFGDYYLSSEDAGQFENSPCIDAGSDTAEALGLAHLTTRTDNLSDTGLVDMGYHYPIYFGGPTMECSLNATEFSPGSYLIGSLEVANDGPDIQVDVYVAFILPDGMVFCITPNGALTNELTPWMEYMTLPEGCSLGPAPMFESVVPGGIPEGEYLFAAALSAPGSFGLIGELSLSEFSISL